MSLSILNNVSSLAAQNQLSMTQASLQKTLLQLSSGSRLNSGADDAAGLAIADGLHANITALTQSARNASDGVGSLQVADGALAQVTARRFQWNSDRHQRRRADQRNCCSDGSGSPDDCDRRRGCRSWRTGRGNKPPAERFERYHQPGAEPDQRGRWYSRR